MSGDPGYFGPSSMMWKVNKEITVLFGGARALLMHAAHPLIAAGARQTSFYQRDPWKRLIRTLSLQNSVTFGTKKRLMRVPIELISFMKSSRVLMKSLVTYMTH